MVNYHPAKFGRHRYSGKEDMLLVGHVISQEYVIKELCDFMGESSL